MKKLMTLMLSLCLGSMLLAQNLVEKKDYYDLFETKIKTVWHEKGDGSKHGIENGFYENGELKYTHNWENGVWTSLKYYFQDGQTRIEAKRLSSGKFDGQQLFYLFENGQRYLKVKAIVATDVVKEYYFYEKPNILGWSLIFNDNTYIYKKYNSTGSEIANISIASGLVTGVIEQIDYENSKFILKDNNIVSFKDNERVTKEVSSGLILSEWNQNDLTWSLYRRKTKNYYFEVKNELTVDLFNVQIALDVRVKENKYKNENVWYPDPTSGTGKTNINSLINSIFEQYQEDSIKTCRNSKGIKVTEIKYDKGQELWSKEYWDNGNIKNQKFGKLGYTLSGINAQRILSYNEQGILTKETEGENYIIYSEKGEIIDSKALNDTLNLIVNSVASSYSSIQENRQTINSFMKQIGLNAETGEFMNILYDKTDQNIFFAIQILCKEYIQNWIDISKEGNEKGFLSSTNQIFKNLNSVPAKINYIKEWNLYNEKLQSFLYKFYSVIEKFVTILKSPEQSSIYNKNLKNIKDPNEIRNIISIKE